MSNVYTLAGVQPKSIGLYMSTRSDRPILPNTRDRTLVIPGRNGAWDFGADMEARNFALDCALIQSDPYSLQIAVENLAHILVDIYGRPKTIPLIFSEHPDRTYNVRYSGSLSIDRLAGMGKFSLPLIAFNPYATGPEQVVEEVITDSPVQIEVTSEGEIRTEPVITLSNEGTSTIHSFRISNEYRLE